ncbi:MAG: calcium/sodium antiporter [Alphaproteobacteria bacterium]|nr:calcium/sodium antiporter [Alphaproteobacteria bacterium]
MVYLMLALGLFLLVYGGNMLVDGSVVVAKKMGLSSLVIGLVLVGFGTSTPELLASLISVYKGSNGIAVGNVIGSNIANILLVLGLAALVHPIQIDIKDFKRDGVVLMVASLMVLGASFLGIINRLMGLVFVLVLMGYVYYCYKTDKKNHQDEIEIPQNTLSLPKALFKSIIGIALTMLGAKFLIDNAITLARLWGVSEAVIGLTIVAVGTSLPELTASVIASIKKENGVAFGNVVGSNIYNALFILGTVALLLPIKIDASMQIDSLIMLLVASVLTGIAFWKKEFSRSVGLLFVLSYIGYVFYLF